MHLRIPNSETLYKNLYWIIIATFLLSMFSNSVPRVLINGTVILAISIGIIRKNSSIIIKDQIVLLTFLLYCVASFVLFIINGYPKYVLLSAIAGSFLPIVLAFCRDTDLYERFYNNTFVALVISFVISLLLHINTSQFYCDYLYNMGYTSSNSIFWAKYFFQGLFGVTSLGTLSTCTALFYLCKLYQDKKMKTAIMMGISIVTLFVTTRRSAIAAFLLGASYIIVSNTFKRFMKKKYKINVKTLSVILLIVIIGIYAVIKNYESIIVIMSRVSNISGAVGERSDEWRKNIQSLSEFQIFFGTGFGSRSHTALQYGLQAVTDSGFVQLFCELGLLGFILFIACITTITIKCIRVPNKNYYYLSSMLIIFVYLLQAIGSNVFEFQVTSPLFWVSLGYCINKKGRMN